MDFNGKLTENVEYRDETAYSASDNTLVHLQKSIVDKIRNLKGTNALYNQGQLELLTTDAQNISDDDSSEDNGEA